MQLVVHGRNRTVLKRLKARQAHITGFLLGYTHTKCSILTLKCEGALHAGQLAECPPAHGFLVECPQQTGSQENNMRTGKRDLAPPGED